MNKKTVGGEQDKDQFYFKGKWFDTPEEMFEYANKWKNFPLDQESAERILDSLKKDIVMNVFMNGKPFNNGEFSSYVEEIFEFSMQKLNEEKR